MISITVPAADRALITLAEARVAIGLTSVDTSKDDILETLRMRVSDAIARECGVLADGPVIPTLREETIRETIRPRSEMEYLILSRLPIVSITSVTADGTLLETDKFEVDRTTGVLTRLYDDDPCYWTSSKIVIVYVAGWSTVPTDLKLAATRLVSGVYSQSTRDPALKRIRIDDVSEREYWSTATSNMVFTKEVTDLLAPFRSRWIA